jgi:hypothetical protein
MQVLREVQKVIPSTSGDWKDETRRLRAFCRVYRNLADGPRSLRNLDDTFPDSIHTNEWKQDTHNKVAKLKSFSEVLSDTGVAR